MIPEMQELKGKALTACGPVEPEALGKVMMHEHLHSDWNGLLPRHRRSPFFSRK